MQRKNEDKSKKITKRKRQKWQPSRISLEPVRILREEKEKLMNELAKIIFDVSQNINLNLAEAYDKS